MSFLNYLKSNVKYKPVEEEEISNDLVLVSNTCEQVWQKVKGGMKWVELPTDSFIVFPDEIKNWLDMYNYVKGLDTRGSKTESKWDENMEAYMLMCEREKKMLTFERPPSEIFQRMFELVPFIMKGKKALPFVNKICQVHLGPEDNESRVYDWTLKHSDSYQESKKWLFGNKICHVVRNPDFPYVGYGVVTKMILNPINYKRTVNVTLLK